MEFVNLDRVLVWMDTMGLIAHEQLIDVLMDVLESVNASAVPANVNRVSVAVRARFQLCPLIDAPETARAMESVWDKFALVTLDSLELIAQENSTAEITAVDTVFALTGIASASLDLVSTQRLHTTQMIVQRWSTCVPTGAVVTGSALNEVLAHATEVSPDLIVQLQSSAQ